MTKILKGLSSVINEFDIFFVDLWGVIHNGVVAFPGAIDFLENAKSQKKDVFFLSNAPRIREEAVKKLNSLGIEPSSYTDVYTSGEECRYYLKTRPNDFYKNLGTKVLHLGPERDKSILIALTDYQEVENVEEADFLLITGIEGFPKSEEEHILEVAAKRKLPAICANSDKIVFLEEELVLCAGAIAERYENKLSGGPVFYHGKPHQSVYEETHRLAEKHRNEKINKEKILMIGDSFLTDIKGASEYGIKSLLVLTGIHQKDLPSSIEDSSFLPFLEKLSSAYGVSPSYVTHRLCYDDQSL